MKSKNQFQVFGEYEEEIVGVAFYRTMSEYHLQQFNYFSNMISSLCSTAIVDEELYNFASIRANYHQNQKNYYEYLMFADKDENNKFDSYADIGEMFL